MPTAKPVVLVPFHHAIEPACDSSLRALERAGIEVRRESGTPIDRGRSIMASEALHDGGDALLFIDSDIAFDPADAFRFLEDPEPVLAGVYCRRSQAGVAGLFADRKVPMGLAGGRYPLIGAGAGFLRIRSEVLRRLVDELGLPLCDADPGTRGFWPFFLPMVVDDPKGGPRYLCEDFAFSWRCHEIGIAPMADTRVRLWHMGSYPYQFEDIGGPRQQFPVVTLNFEEPTWGAGRIAASAEKAPTPPRP